MNCRLYIGRLSHRAVERDVERFFKGFGRIREILLKNGYGFVEFEDNRDADDAVYELNGKELCGERVTIEHARAPPGMRGSRRRSRSPRRGNRAGGSDSRKEFGPPVRTDYRIIVENLSSRVSWQDLKDLMRKTGEVSYADAHKSRRNEGIVEFSTYSDMKSAIDKYDGMELHGRRLKLVEDKPRRRSRSRSRSRRSRSRSASRSRSRSRSRDRRSRSRSGKRSRSRSDRRSRSRDRSRSGKRSRSPSDKRSRSRDRSRDRSHSRGKDRKERSFSAEDRKSRSRSTSQPRDRSRDQTEEEDGRDAAGAADNGAAKNGTGSREASKSASKSASRSPPRKRLAAGSRSRSASRSRSPLRNGEDD